MTFARDPLSVRFDGRAAAFVRRAYERKGEWVTDFVPPPGPRARAWMALHGIFRPYERDRWGEIRWIRAYKRSVYHLVSYHGGVRGLRAEVNAGAGSAGWHAPVRVEWQTGIRAERPEWTAARWAVRIRLHPAGAATSRIGLRNAVRAGDNWMSRDGHPTFRATNAAERDQA